MRKLLYVSVVAFAAALASPSSAQDLTFAVEGGFGLRVGTPLVPIGNGIRTDLDTPQPGSIDIGSIRPFTGRAEAIFVSAPMAGGFVITAGVVGAGWFDGGEAENTAFGVVTCKPGPLGAKPECEIKVCDDLQPCAAWNSSSFGLYREVMPVAGFGWRSGDGSLVTFGARPFYGRLNEAFAVSDGTINIREWSDALGANFVGALAVAEVDRPLGERFHLLFSGGAGFYRFAAHEELYDLDLVGAGVRAQAATGLSVDIGDRLALGVMGRLDWWSAWPGVTTPTPEQFRCYIKQPQGDPVCEPPKVTGGFGAATGPAWNAGLAVRLSLRLGG